jgi:teichuronic acid exporter
MTVRKAAAAGMWSSLDVVLRQGVGFGVSIVLARLLTPADFGIVALLMFFSNLSIVFVQGGLTTALIQQQESTRDEESAVFWFNLAASIVFAAILLVIAPWIARFYGYPILAKLMPCAAAQVVFSAFGAVQTALLTRNLQFGQLTIAGAVSAGLSGAIGISAAVLGFGVWAIALQMVSMALVNSAVLWGLCKWRPTAHFHLVTIRRLFRFGFYLSLSSILDVVNGQGFALIIGKLYGAADLGLFNRANGTQQFATGTLTTIISRVALPSFASRAKDSEALRRGLRIDESAGPVSLLHKMRLSHHRGSPAA